MKDDAARKLNIKLERCCDEIEKAYDYYLAETGEMKDKTIEEAVDVIRRVGAESPKEEERSVLLSIDTVPAKTRKLNDSDNPVSKWEDIERELRADGNEPGVLHYSFTLKKGDEYLPLTGQIDEENARREFKRLEGVFKDFDSFFEEAKNGISGKD